jgi:hypothetical protein
MVRERAPHYAIDRGVVGELLGLDDEVAHNPTLDRTSPRMRLVYRPPTVLIRTSRAGSTADQKDQHWHSHIGMIDQRQ